MESRSEGLKSLPERYSVFSREKPFINKHCERWSPKLLICREASQWERVRVTVVEACAQRHAGTCQTTPSSCPESWRPGGRWGRHRVASDAGSCSGLCRVPGRGRLRVFTKQGSREREVESIHQQKSECPRTVVFKLSTGDTWTSLRSFQGVCVVKTFSIIIPGLCLFHSHPFCERTVEFSGGHMVCIDIIVLMAKGMCVFLFKSVSVLISNTV